MLNRKHIWAPLSLSTIMAEHDRASGDSTHVRYM